MGVPDYEARALDLLPPEVVDYYAGGSGREQTLRDNPAAWSRVRLRPRALRDVSRVDTATTVLGTPVAAPVLVAPMAFQGLVHADADRATALGAARAGTLLTVSTRSSLPVEDIGADPWWFQVYVMRDRDLTARLAARAAAAGARALVLTADTPVVARKHRNDRAGAVSEEHFLAALGPGADAASAEQAADITFDEVARLRRDWGLPVVVKGVLRADDARAAVEAGAAAVLVSNHGGRQLDGAVATADCLREVVAAVDGRAEVYVDGGVRTGTDVLRALAMGARAVLLGRPVLWALAVDGADGVHAVLSGLADDLAHTMALAGAPTVADVTTDLLAP